MTDRFKGFLVTLDKEIREDDAKHIINALKMIRGVLSVKPYVNGAEDWMMYEKGVLDNRQQLFEFLNKKIKEPTE